MTERQELSSTRRQERKRKHEVSSSDDKSDQNVLSETTNRAPNPASWESNEVIDSRQHVPCAHTCDWCKESINNLNISVITTRSYSPLTLIEMIKDWKNVGKTREMMDDCMAFILGSTNPLDILNCSDLDENNYISLETIKSLQMKFSNRWYMDSLRKNEHNGWLERFSEKFRVHGEEFAQQLLNMKFVVNKGQMLSEDMYKTLFGHFASIFGLSSFRKPALTETHMKIGKTEVTSIPDMIFPDLVSTLDESEEEMNILAVGKVKRDFIQVEDSTNQLRISNEEQERINHIDSNLHGQIGGDLLLHFPLSAYRGLLGIIVQKTNVTFAYFDCKKMQFDEIKSGTFNFPNKPYIYYSEPLNFLKVNDRNKLVEPLLRLGFLQSGPG